MLDYPIDPIHFENLIPTGSGDPLIDGFAKLVSDRVHDGWSCNLVTFLFHELPGTRGAVIGRMRDEVERVYSTLVTRVHRKPKTAPTDELPVFIGAADFPVYKRDRSAIPEVFCNGGLHAHVLGLIPPGSRPKGSLADHLDQKRDLYVGSGSSIQRIHVEPVTRDEARVVDYVFKTIRNSRLSYDEAVIVLPRARAELG
jgi:nucleotidyltransferase/DNA polymerase involved in DNA repair